MGVYFHSVTLDEEKCKGCTNCIKRCPTEAIRVRKGKARIIDERCIDCGECIRVCPHHAKNAITDSIEMIKLYKYKVVIPAPSLYGQFKSVYSRNHILTALKLIGFDEVYEVAKAAEIISRATKELLMQKGNNMPVISSACPAVVRLIQVRFPNLIDNILKLESPMEVAAKIVRKNIAKREGLDNSDIGVFFITPCAAKMTSVKAPYEREHSSVSGVISIKDVYLSILNNLMRSKNSEELMIAGHEGIGWANSGGESLALGTESYLAVDGIREVITILEEVEKDRLEDVIFIEALACKGGCLGGPLTIENSYVAKTRLKKHIDEARKIPQKLDEHQETYDNLVWTNDVQYKSVLKLDNDIEKAMKMLEDLENIVSELPGLDCGSCGAPTCRALAEDIVREIANETDCIFKLRERVRDLAFQMMELEAIKPPVMDRSTSRNGEDQNESK